MRYWCVFKRHSNITHECELSERLLFPLFSNYSGDHQCRSWSPNRCMNTQSLITNTYYFSSAWKYVSQGCEGTIGAVWFRFFQKHQIWPICRPYHTFSIFLGRQEKSNMAATLVEVDRSLFLRGRGARIMNNTTF